MLKVPAPAGLPLRHTRGGKITDSVEGCMYMNFDRWLTETPGGRHCLTILAASECEAGPVVLELAFVAGQIDQAERDRALMQEKLSVQPAGGTAADAVTPGRG